MAPLLATGQRPNRGRKPKRYSVLPSVSLFPLLLVLPIALTLLCCYVTCSVLPVFASLCFARLCFRCLALSFFPLPGSSVVPSALHSPYSTLCSCPTLPYPALPYPTLPYPTLPSSPSSPFPPPPSPSHTECPGTCTSHLLLPTGRPRYLLPICPFFPLCTL